MRSVSQTTDSIILTSSSDRINLPDFEVVVLTLAMNCTSSSERELRLVVSFTSSAVYLILLELWKDAFAERELPHPGLQTGEYLLAPVTLN